VKKREKTSFDPSSLTGSRPPGIGFLVKKREKTKVKLFPAALAAVGLRGIFKAK